VALIRAMLDDAIACYQKYERAKGRRNQRIATDAAAWLFSDDAHWPFAFVNVCAVLGIEPGYVRRGLKRWRHVSLAQTRPTRRRTNTARYDLPNLPIAARPLRRRITADFAVGARSMYHRLAVS
jgi:hypothetical protein